MKLKPKSGQKLLLQFGGIIIIGVAMYLSQILWIEIAFLIGFIGLAVFFFGLDIMEYKGDNSNDDFP